MIQWGNIVLRLRLFTKVFINLFICYEQVFLKPAGIEPWP
jgi:hypothetical protein